MMSDHDVEVSICTTRDFMVSYATSSEFAEYKIPLMPGFHSTAPTSLLSLFP